MTSVTQLYEQRRFFIQTVDPVHIGTGGMRLGRVDNSIVREPGTRLPKIPGTSLSGAIRQYAAFCYESKQCAGAGQGGGSKHCKDKRCPICHTFGFLSGQDGGQSGTVSIGDAQLLVFPVHSLAGPVWVTCPAVLSEFGITESIPEKQKVGLPENLKTKNGHLNLGWLMLEKAGNEFAWPTQKISQVPVKITERTVLISDNLFSRVVNSNLEVRTSVSIDPETGAASDKALFTYEAIPRAAILWMDVVQDNYRNSFPTTEKKCRIEEIVKEEKKIKTYHHNDGEPLGETWANPLDVVSAGLRLAEHLGIGGMGTRGFGRIKLLEKEKSNDS